MARGLLGALRMGSKLLRWVVVLALVALVAGSFTALGVVRDRVHVTIEEEEIARGPDPIALLAADLAALRDDVHALGTGVAIQVRESSEALEASAGEREASLSASLAEVRRELVSLRERVDRQRIEQVSTPAAAVLEHPAPPVEEPAPAPTSAAVPQAPAKKRFLSFQLPSRSFVFGERQRFAVVPGLSRVGFDAKSTLHDFSGVTTAIEGQITADLGRPGEGCSGVVRVQAGTLDTGLEARDEAMREILEPTRFREIRFDWDAFEATRVDVAEEEIAGVARGRLTIHGNSRPVSMPVTVTVDASKRLTIDGQTSIRMSDFGVKPPSKLGLISVEDDATVWIALRARSLGPAPEGR